MQHFPATGRCLLPELSISVQEDDYMPACFYVLWITVVLTILLRQRRVSNKVNHGIYELMNLSQMGYVILHVIVYLGFIFQLGCGWKTSKRRGQGGILTRCLIHLSWRLWRQSSSSSPLISPCLSKLLTLSLKPMSLTDCTKKLNVNFELAFCN